MPKTSKIVTATQLKNVGLKTIAVGGVSELYFRSRPYQSYFFLRFQVKTGTTKQQAIQAFVKRVLPGSLLS